MNRFESLNSLQLYDDEILNNEVRDQVANRFSLVVEPNSFLSFITYVALIKLNAESVLINAFE